MSRTVVEWVGATDDTPIPARVKDRVRLRCGAKCSECGIAVDGRIRGDVDHVRAIILGGENRESNLQLLCLPCHRSKTKRDVAAKAVAYRKRMKHLGFDKPKRPFPGSKASGFKRKMNGEVERR